MSQAQQPRRAAARFPVVALLILLVAAFIGYRAASYEPGVVRCGADVMAPGDTCLSTDSGGGSYEEVRVAQERNHRVDLIVALGSAGVSGVMLGQWLLRRARGRPSTRPGPSR